MDEDQVDRLVEAIESLEYSLFLLFDKDGKAMKEKIHSDLLRAQAQHSAKESNVTLEAGHTS